MHRAWTLWMSSVLFAVPIALYPLAAASKTPLCPGHLDADEDFACDDGDSSGIVGDNPCQGGNTVECDDNCLSVPNFDQVDSDDDGVGQLCDNCLDHENPVLGMLGQPDRESFQTTTGGQLDSDGDGFGNRCDPNYDNAGQVVGGTDLAELIASFNKDRSGTNCGTTGNARCEEFDHDNSGQFIGGVDQGTALQFFNHPEGPKCAACPLACEGPGCPL